MLFAFWLILAGRIDVQYAALGLLVAVTVTAFTARLFPRDGVGSERRAGSTPADVLAIVPLVASYVAVLMRDLILANLRVAYVVLHPRLPISPVYYEYSPPVTAPWARVLLANSVTLTPGTLSVEVTPDQFLVHALTPGAADSLPDWSAERRIARIEQLLSRREQP